MNTKNFFIADPFNDEHLRLFEEFENINNKKKPVSTYLTGIRKAYDDKASFKKIENANNEINIIAFTMNKDSIRDYCYIKGEKDRKVCELFFADLNSNPSYRPIMEKISDYVINFMGMELLSVSVSDEKNKLYSQLTNHGYIDIGEVNGQTRLIKEKEDVYEMSKVI